MCYVLYKKWTITLTRHMHWSWNLWLVSYLTVPFRTEIWMKCIPWFVRMVYSTSYEIYSEFGTRFNELTFISFLNQTVLFCDNTTDFEIELYYFANDIFNNHNEILICHHYSGYIENVWCSALSIFYHSKLDFFMNLMYLTSFTTASTVYYWQFAPSSEGLAIHINTILWKWKLFLKMYMRNLAKIKLRVHLNIYLG